jgi:hypothetical protein
MRYRITTERIIDDKDGSSVSTFVATAVPILDGILNGRDGGYQAEGETKQAALEKLHKLLEKEKSQAT